MITGLSMLYWQKVVVKVNILFYDFIIKVNNPEGKLNHINEVLGSLAKIGHKVVSLDTVYAKDKVKSSINLRPSVWTRIRGSISGSKIIKPIMGEIYILWQFLREIRIFWVALIALARRERIIDIIYRRHGLYNSEYLLAKLFKIPLVREVNGIVADEAKISKEGDRVSLWVIDRIERFSMPRADKIIVVTSKLKEILQKDYEIPRDKIAVIQNGANTDLFKPKETARARAELGLNRSSNYVCYVGSFSPWQGIEYLIRSVPLILKKCPKTRFLIVGDGLMKQDLIELAKQIGVSDKVIFTGMVPYQKVPLYMNAADVCTSPKAGLRSGYSPLKLCEYMACGKPVVASRASGLEIVEDSGGGILVEPKEPKALAAAMTKLLQNRELRKRMGEKGRKYVVENQSWESVARRVADLCQSLIDSRRNKGEQ
jgi:glycosyltransferase involved in cell wall biosynthesis